MRGCLENCGRFLKEQVLTCLETSRSEAPVDAKLIGEHAFDLGGEHVLLVVGRRGVSSRFAVVARLASALGRLVKSINGGLRDAGLFAQVSLDRLVHPDQELVALVAHPRDEDMQTIGFELPITRPSGDAGGRSSR